MRRHQTPAIARAILKLVDDRRVWLGEARTMALDGLDGIPHAFIPGPE
jgi:hypothetical protein